MDMKFQQLNQLKTQAQQWLIETIKRREPCPNIVIFLSYGEQQQRCDVWNTIDIDEKKAIRRILNFLDKIFEKNRKLLTWVKIDLVVQVEQTRWNILTETIQKQKHNNHYRRGISFDENFNLCFLEQEINARAIIRGLSWDKPNFLDEKNLNTAIKRKYPKLNSKLQLDDLNPVWTFETEAIFFEQTQPIALQSGYPNHGIREVAADEFKHHISQMIKGNSSFLLNQILEDGKFRYGYYPAFARELSSYNTIRHCTSVYALIETFEVEARPEYWEKIEKSIQYALENFYREVSADVAYMIDPAGKQVEIRLGANAAAILMLTKYQEHTRNNQYQNYAEKIARGIFTMIDEQGSTTHILNYPECQPIEKFRIIYYDGEAALAMLRLYQLNSDTELLEKVKLMFEYFIRNNYYKHHDHWLSYCTNELTKIEPRKEYFEFGIQNYKSHLQFMKNRKTCYATFLELLMSAYKLVTRLREMGETELFESADFDQLCEVIQYRADYQRTGYMYPEIAMYYARPEQILDGFFIRHDKFRMRIDDQEHNLSGYIAYYNFFRNEVV